MEAVMEKVPDKLWQRLMPFQKEGVTFAVKKDGKCLIADEMGLGKTLQAISVASVYRDEWPLLIIVPSSLKFSWIEELEKWLPAILPCQINLIHSGTDASGINDSPISIISYGLLRIPSSIVVRTAIAARQFKVVICDESHYLKNAKSLSAKVIIPIIKSAQRKILLSGTPALAKPVELYPQIDAICPGKFGSFWQFTERYCDARMVFYGRQKRIRKIDGASNLEELQKKMHSLLMIRREKSEVLTELPPKQRQRVLFDLKDSAQKKEIINRFGHLRQNVAQGNTFFQLLADKESSTTVDASQCKNNADDNDCEEGGVKEIDPESTSVFREISTLYKLSGEAKIGPVRDYIEMLCENDKLKFLVFAYHHSMMDGIQQTLHDKNVKFVRIDGHTKGFERQMHVNAFQSDDSIRVAILSILAAGVGLTLTSAKLVVFAELYWTPGVMVQCEDRAHRIGQVDSLPIHYLVAKNTMDEWVWSAVCRKTHVTSTALTGKCKKLEHEEADSYQVDILSNAEMWKANKDDDESVNVSELIKSQRAPDQPSIVDFLSPARKSSKNSTSLNTPAFGSKTKRFTSLQSVADKPTDKGNSSSRVTKIESNLEEVIVLDSDDEEAFRPPTKKRKKLKDSHKRKDKLDKFSSDYLNKCDKSNKTLNQNSEKNKNEWDHLIVENEKFDNETPDFHSLQLSLHSLEAGDENPDDESLPCNNKQMEKSITVLGKRKSEDVTYSKTENHDSTECSDEQSGSDSHGNDLNTHHEGKTPHKNTDRWPCSCCTFLNHEDLPFCEICDSPKKDITTRSSKRKGTPIPNSNCINSSTVNGLDSDIEIKCDIPKGSFLNSSAADTSSPQTCVLSQNENIRGDRDVCKKDCFLNTKEDDTSNSCNHVSSSPDDKHLRQTSNIEHTNIKHVSTSPAVTKSTWEPDPKSNVSMNHSPVRTPSPLSRLSDVEPKPNQHAVLKFSCSMHTGRIFVHNQHGESLQANFFPIDIELGNTSGLPDVLREPPHLKLIKRFVREWSSLSDTKKKLVAKRGLVFVHPTTASEEVRSVKGITQRYMVKKDLGAAMQKAKGKQGTVRTISHPSQFASDNSSVSDGPQGVNQVVDSEGIPLCLQCEKPYTNSLLPKQMISASENAWLMRLCSYACMDKYWTLNHASYLRDQIYSVERGVCQLCKFNAHEFYNQMRVIKEVKKRAEILRKSTFYKLCSSLRERMVVQPMPGQFWHVDHITPVWQGGGMCDIDNLRTLCTPCHAKVTSRQAGQRATAKKLSSAVSSGDISAFFQR